MGRIIAIANQKGGVGKTTTTINLGAFLAEMGNKVLVIDADSQGNTTTGLGVDKNELEHTFYDILSARSTFEQALIEIPDFDSKLFLIGSNVELSGAEIELIQLEYKEYLMKNFLDTIKDKFDFIIIDCPPALNILTLNALTASNSVLVPMQCEYYALEGLSQLIYIINMVRERLNPELNIEGIAFTMYDKRTNLSQQVIEEVNKYIGTEIYKVIIPRNVRLSEAPSHGLPINKYDKKSAGYESYKLLAETVMEKGEENK